jgi:uncharacterized protein YbjT (DUF2867 family)
MATRKRNPQRILILGANGQVGRILFCKLQTHFPQAEIIGAVRAAHFHFEGVGAGGRAHSVIFDIHRQPWRLGPVDVIINCIGAMRGSEKELLHAHGGTSLAILHNRAAMGNPAIIQVSALGAGGNNPSAFLRSKALADAVVLGKERTWVIRPSILCTPGTVLVQRIRTLRKAAMLMGKHIWLPGNVLRTKVQPLAPDDFAALVAEIIGTEPAQRIVEAGGKEVYNFGQLLRMAGVHTHTLNHYSFSMAAALFRPALSWFISSEEMKLMGINNTVSLGRSAGPLRSRISSTQAFWQQQLNPATRQKKDFSTMFN